MDERGDDAHEGQDRSGAGMYVRTSILNQFGTTAIRKRGCTLFFHPFWLEHLFQTSTSYMYQQPHPLISSGNR